MIDWESISTPRTDKLLEERYTPHGPLEELCKRLERELWLTTLAVGVASKERGEWAVEREDLLARLNAMAEHGNTLIGALAGQNIDLREKRKS